MEGGGDAVYDRLCEGDLYSLIAYRLDEVMEHIKAK